MLSEITYTASAGQTNFSITFPYLDREHLYVYINDVETTDYTFNSSTVIALDSGADEGDEVLIRRITPRDEPIVDYTNGANLGESDLDAGVLQNLFILQEIWEHPEELGSSEHTLDSHIDGLGAGESTVQGTMRVYNEDGKWAALDAPSTGGVLIGDEVVPEGVRWLPKGTDGQVLTVDDAVGGKVKWAAGFASIFTAIGDIVYASAVGVAARLAIGATGYILTVVGGVPTWASPGSVAFSTGDAKLTLKTSADSGWVLCNDGTIGSATSGATARANADCEDLFLFLWNTFADGVCAVSGGRGASAAADWAANKTIALTKQLGRGILIAGSGSGLTARSLGTTGGSEDAVVVQHNHTASDSGHAHQEMHNDTTVGAPTLAYQGGGGGAPVAVGVAASMYDTPGGALNTATSTANISVNNSGVSGTGANMQPWSAWNVMVKL